MLGNFRPLDEILMNDTIFRGITFFLREFPSKFNSQSVIDRPVIFGEIGSHYLKQGIDGFENGEIFDGVRIYHREINGILVADKSPNIPGSPSFLYDSSKGLLVPFVKWQKYEYASIG